jgi:hypothetical protein
LEQSFKECSFPAWYSNHGSKQRSPGSETETTGEYEHMHDSDPRWFTAYCARAKRHELQMGVALALEEGPSVSAGRRILAPLISRAMTCHTKQEHRSKTTDKVLKSHAGDTTVMHSI